MSSINFYTRENSNDTWSLLADNDMIVIDSLRHNQVLDETFDNAEFSFYSTTRLENITPFTQSNLVIEDTIAKSEFETGRIHPIAGDEFSSSIRKRTGFISARPSQNYTYNVISTVTLDISVFEYDSDYNYLGYNKEETTLSITTNKKTRYIRMVLGRPTNTDFEYDDFEAPTVALNNYMYACSNCKINVSTGRATHKVRLIEPTKILEFIQCEGLSFFRTSNDTTEDSILDVLNRLNNTHTQYTDGNIDIYNVSDNISSYLNDIKAPIFEWESGLTLLECLKEVGDFIGGMPRISGEDFNTLSFDWYNRQVQELDITRYNNLEIDQREEDYCERLGDVYENIYSESPDSNIVICPYRNGYITARSKTAEISNDTAVIKVPHNIFSLKKLYCSNFRLIELTYSAIFKGYNAEGDWVEVTDTNVNIKQEDTSDPLECVHKADITNRVLEKGDYDLLPAKGSESKEDYIYYTKDGQYIEGLNYNVDRIFGLTGDYAIFNAIEASDTKPTGEDAVEFVNITRDLISIGSIEDLQEVEFTEWTPVVNKGTKIYETLFNVEYSTTTSGKLQSVKDKLAYFDNTQKQLSSIYGQGTKSKNLIAAGRANWAATQKLGNQYKIYTISVNSYNELPVINSVTSDDFVLTNISIQWLGNNKLTALLELNKNFNRLSEFLDLHKQYRTWDIAKTQFIKRRTLSSEHIIVGSGNGYEEELSTTTDVFKDAVTGIFGLINETMPVNVTSASLYCDIGIANSVLPCDSLAFGKSIKFMVDTKDNLSAGQYSESIESDDYRAAREFIYANEYGKTDRVSVVFYTEGYDFDSLSQSAKITAAHQYPDMYGSSSNEQFSYTNFSYDKSAGESIQVTKQFHFRPTSDDYIVGFGLAELNPCISNYTELPNIRLYYVPDTISTMAISVFEYPNHYLAHSTARDIITKQILNYSTIGGEEITTRAVRLEFDLPQVDGEDFDVQTTYKAWVITDDNGLIVVGSNNKNIDTIKFGFKE